MTEQAPRTGRHKVNLRRQLVTITIWRAMVVLCSSMVVLVIAGIGYTSYVDGQREQSEREARSELARQEREMDRRWCAVLVPLNRAYTATPPTTPIGQQVAKAFAALVVEFDCPDR